MSDFTYICICYNQEDYIVNHLESIKAVINTYGRNINNYLIIADDCSKDLTVERIKEWIFNNQGLFTGTKLIINEKNVGTVKNILNAVDNCETNDFKVLAGDDEYCKKDIYHLYKEIGNTIIITPVIPIGPINNYSKQIIKSMTRSFCMVQHYSERNQLDELVRIKNHIIAPGVFLPGKYWKDHSLRIHLEEYTFIEDVPMWMCLIEEKKVRVQVRLDSYVRYRLPCKNRKINGTDVNVLRKQDSDRIDILFKEKKVSSFQMLKYNLIKIYYTFFTYR